jgi:hypothetical protein
MAAYVVGPLQFATVGAFRVGLVRQRLMAAAHAGAGRRGLSLWYGHGTAPLFSNDVCPANRAGHDRNPQLDKKRERRRLAEQPIYRNASWILGLMDFGNSTANASLPRFHR